MGPGALLVLIALLGLGVVGDGYRLRFEIPAWQLWGAVAVLAGVTLIAGARRGAPVAPVMPWHLALATRDYEAALKALVSAVQEDPEDLTLYREIAELYLRDSVALPSDALAWLTAAIERADDTEYGAELRFRRAEVLHRSLGASRQAGVDLLTIEKRFPGTSVAARATDLRERLQVVRKTTAG